MELLILLSKLLISFHLRNWWGYQKFCREISFGKFIRFSKFFIGLSVGELLGLSNLLKRLLGGKFVVLSELFTVFMGYQNFYCFFDQLENFWGYHSFSWGYQNFFMGLSVGKLFWLSELLMALLARIFIGLSVFLTV